MTKTLWVVDEENENEIQYSVYADGDRGGILTGEEFALREKFKNCVYKKTMRFFREENSSAYTVSSNASDDTPLYAAEVFYEDC